MSKFLIINNQKLEYNIHKHTLSLLELRPIGYDNKLLIRRSRVQIVLAIGFREEMQSLAPLFSLAPKAYQHTDDDDEEEEGESVGQTEAEIEEVAAWVGRRLVCGCDGWRFAFGG